MFPPQSTVAIPRGIPGTSAPRLAAAERECTTARAITPPRRMAGKRASSKGLVPRWKLSCATPRSAQVSARCFSVRVFELWQVSSHKLRFVVACLCLKFMFDQFQARAILPASMAASALLKNASALPDSIMARIVNQVCLSIIFSSGWKLTH